MKKPLTLLHLEDSAADAELLGAMLSETFELNYRRAESESEFLRHLASPDLDLIISDYTLPSYNGLLALKSARSERPEVPFIFFSGTIGEEAAVDTLTQGATDYILKNKPRKLLSAIERALREREERNSRRKAEETLKKREEWFRALTENSLDIITVVDCAGIISYSSPAVTRALGYTPEELVGVNCFTLLHPQDAATATAALERAWMDPGHNALHEARVKHKDGSWRWFESIGKRLPASVNEAGIAVNSRDITEKKETEEKFLRAQRLESLGALAGGIAHDLNNILSPVMMATELLKFQVTDPENVRILDTLHVSAQRGSQIVGQILSFARGVSKDKHVSMDLPLLVKEVVRLIRSTLPRSIQIQTLLPRTCWPIEGNPTELHQVLMNLCVNARDAMPEGGLLQLRLQNFETNSPLLIQGAPMAGKFVQVTVSDTGTGMPPEIQQKIFQPFFTTKPEGKGTGLGLPTVKSIIKRHNGFLDLESAPNEGTRFHLYFPASTPADAQTLPVAQENISGNGATILLVDDEAAILELTRALLEGKGFNVLIAPDGLKASQIFKRTPGISAVVTDLAMPMLDGIQLAREVKAQNPLTPVILTTGQHIPSEEINRRFDLKVDYILIKPYSAEDILHALAACKAAGLRNTQPIPSLPA